MLNEIEVSIEGTTTRQEAIEMLKRVIELLEQEADVSLEDKGISVFISSSYDTY